MLFTFLRFPYGKTQFCESKLTIYGNNPANILYPPQHPAKVPKILTSRRTFTRLRLPDAGGFGDFHAAVPLRILLLRFNGDKFQPPQGRMRF